MRIAPPLAILAALAALPAAADVIHLRQGGRVEGRVTDLGDFLEIDTGRAKFKVGKSDVERIEAKPWTPPEAPPPAAKADARPADPAPAPARPKLGEAYSHPFLAFTFRPPLDWKTGEAAAAAALSFYGPAEKFYVPRLDIVHVRIGEGDMLDDFIRKWKTSHERSFPGWSVVSEEPTGVNGVLGRRIVSTLGGDSAPLKNLSVALWQGSRIFVLSFTTGRGFFDRYAPLVERSIRSFRILPEAQLDETQRRTFQARFNAAAEHLQAGRQEDALAAFRACAELLPAFADVHRALGGLYAEMRRPAEAVASYRRAVALDPDHADAHYNLGTLLLGQDRVEEAVKMLKKAVALDPDHERAWINLGTAHIARESWAEARAALERGCVLVPDSVVAHLSLARVFEAQNDPARAAREYRDVLQLDKGNAAAQAALERVAERK